jgi:crotonobetainyl-CoA:carnitine CoA-transferase CaiB-like acyl-CoA transferase
VVDLSSLWAGPLCSQLLGAAGARVIKLESRTRPDGARYGPSAFFDLMNADKQSVALDFQNLEDLRALRALIAAADIVVESARPRALRQLGIDALTSIRQSAGQVWLSITGYGRAEPQANWVAFGDDAAVAAGLFLRADDEATPPAFCADAVADPLAGLHAAIAALTCWRAGGGMLLDVALRDVAAHAMAFGETPSPALVRPRSSDPENPENPQDPQDPRDPRDRQDRQDRQAVQSRPPGPWEVLADGESQAVLPPRTRVATGRAPALGADTRAVLQELAPTC